MRSNPLCVLLPAALALCALPALFADSHTILTEEVDCTDPDPDKHDSINDALEKKADELIIEVSGLCQEDVAIRRDNVTLLGSDPSQDGIEAVEGVFGIYALHLRDAYMVRIENLKITNAEVGLRTDGSKHVWVVNCLLQGNGIAGAQVFDASSVEMEGAVISDNGSTAERTGVGLRVDDSFVRCTNCTIQDNGRWQVFNNHSGEARLEGSQVSGWRGVLGYPASLTIGINSTVTADQWALVSTEADVTWQTGEIVGSMLAGYGGVIDLYGATQTSQSIANFVSEDSLLVAQGRDGTPTTLVGMTILENMSSGVFYGDGASNGGVTLDGLDCQSGADAVCHGTVNRTSSTCGLCP
jgi:hypothetical protein